MVCVRTVGSPAWRVRHDVPAGPDPAGPRIASCLQTTGTTIVIG